MSRIPCVVLSALVALLAAAGLSAQGNASQRPVHFAIDPGRPFAYLKFGHIGPSGETRSRYRACGFGSSTTAKCPS
jgi:hypothetical protein